MGYKKGVVKKAEQINLNGTHDHILRSVTLGADLPVMPSPFLPKLKSTDVEITPATAKAILTDHAFEGQRPVSRKQVDCIVNALKINGVVVGSQIRLVRVGEKLYLTDGQHRLHAIVQSGIPLTVSVCEVKGNSMADVAWDYTHNYGIKDRTPGQRYAASGLPSMSELSKTDFNAFTAGVSPIVGGLLISSWGNNTSQQKLYDVMAQAIEDFIPEGQKYFDATQNANRVYAHGFRRKPVVALGLITFRYQPDKAFDFWYGAAQNDGLKRNDPRNSLITWLSDRPSKLWPNEKYFGQIARLWNSFYRGEPNAAPKPHMPPYLIEGTPHYDGLSFYMPYGGESA